MPAPTKSELRGLARRDPALGAAMKRLPAFPGFPVGVECRRTHYQSLARAIVYQQLAGKAAATIHGRVCDLTPGNGFPRPEEIVAMPETVLRGAGLSRQKIAAVNDLAERILDRRLVLGAAGRLPDEEVVKRLITVRGIGEWSAQMFLLFKLGRPDVMAPNDLGLQEGLRILDDLPARPKPKELEARAEVWAPLRSVASWYLWRLVSEARD